MFVEGLRAEEQRRSGRAPTPEEERGLVARFLDEEVLYREALALGLDRGDLIVRRRLVQKMEFLTQDAAPLPAPDDAALQRWLDQHPDEFRAPPRLSFRHVFLNRERRGPTIDADARELLSSLRGGVDPDRLGDPFLVGSRFALRSEGEIARVFGAPFAALVEALPAGAWSDPLPSSFGLHLVAVEQRIEGTTPSLASVRERVRQGLLAARRGEANRAALDALRSRYAISVEWPAPARLASAPSGKR